MNYFNYFENLFNYFELLYFKTNFDQGFNFRGHHFSSNLNFPINYYLIKSIPYRH